MVDWPQAPKSDDEAKPVWPVAKEQVAESQPPAGKAAADQAPAGDAAAGQAPAPSDAGDGSIMDAVGKYARKMDASHLSGQVNAVGWKQLENIIMQMLGPYVSSESRDVLSQIAQMELRLGTLKEANQQLEALILEADKEVKLAQHQYEELQNHAKKASVDLRAQIEAMEQRVAQLEAEVGEANMARLQVERSADELQDSLLELQEKKKNLEKISGIKNPRKRLRELEEAIAHHKELLEQLMRELDAFDGGDVYIGEVIATRVNAIHQRIDALQRQSQEAQQGTGDLLAHANETRQRYQQTVAEINQFVQFMEADEGSLDIFADLIRANTRLRCLTEQLDLVSTSLDLLEASTEEMQVRQA